MCAGTIGHSFAAIAPVERWVVCQNGRVQVLRRFSGIDAELTGKQVADTPVGGERLSLPSAAIKRQHELAVQPLPQGMVGGQPLQLAGERIVPAERQVSVNPRLRCGEP